MFDIEQFLIDNKIEYRKSGENVAKGNVNINCPFCDHDDKFHMGIHPKKLVFGCWRSSEHKDRKIERLVQKLLNCSKDYAKLIVRGNKETTIDSNIDLVTYISQKLFKADKYTTDDNKAHIGHDLSEFKAFKTIKSDTVYYNYLKSRGFDTVSLLIDKYNLKFSATGKWAGRIIFPVYINNRLVTWQGRDITGKSFLRYKDLSKDKSLIHLKACIYNYDNLKGGDILYICEGVFDALKVDYYTNSDVNATCVFTKTVTDEQYKLLFNKVKSYNEVRILFDQGTIKDANLVKGQIKTFNSNSKVVYLSTHIKDAGDMTPEQIRRYL